MAKKGNTRCPLQAECERKCKFEAHELDCDYYNANARDELVIYDQEEIRRERERQREDEIFEALMEDADEEPEDHLAEVGKMVMLPIEELHPHPKNPRKELGDLTELADSIKANGIYQNLTVIRGHWMTQEEWADVSARYKENPSEELQQLMSSKWLDSEYTVVIGHRRRGASKLAGLTHLPCVVVEMTPKEQLQTMLLENMQRSDLTVYEQAQGFQLMIDMGDTVENIVEKTGFSKTTVKRRLKMAELDPNTLKEVSSRQLSLGDFDRLAQIENIDERNECLKHIGTANFNIEAERRLKKQQIAKNLPAVKAAIRAAQGKKMEQRDTWYGEYSETKDLKSTWTRSKTAW